jgi:large subunit ribosomal protein L4
MKAAALRGALSDRAREGRVHVVEAFVEGDKPSTKTAVGVLGRLTERPRALIVVDRGDSVTWLSLRNLEHIHVLAVDQLNTYDVLASDDVVFTRSAFETFVSTRSTGRTAPPGATSTGSTAAESDTPAADAAAQPEQEEQ